MKIENVKVIQILPLQEGTSANGNAWKNQAYIVQGTGQYDKPVCVECFGKKADEIVLKLDQFVTLDVDVESREYNGRWYTSVRAFRASEPQAAAQPATPSAAPAAAPVTQAPATPPAAPKAPAQAPAGNTLDASTELPF